MLELILDDRISRLTSITDTSGTLASYSYLGLGTVVRRAHPLNTSHTALVGSVTRAELVP